MKKSSIRRLILSCALLLLVCMIWQSAIAGQRSKTPKRLKEQAISVLQALLPTEDDDADKRIEKAIEHIKKSLEDGLWEDASHLTQKGKKVFNEEKAAVMELMKIEGVNVLEIIDSLVSIDMTLAQIAANKTADIAMCYGCYDEGNYDPECDKALKNIAKAETVMDKAQKEYDKGNHDKAIDHCRKAWNHAQKAMKKLSKLGKIFFSRAYVEDCGGRGNYMYLYDEATGIMDTITENCNDVMAVNINPDQTMIVWAESISEDEDSSTIKVYDIASKTTTTITTAFAKGSVAFFDEDGKILFIDYNDGNLKKINTDGTGLATVATPKPPYAFSMRWISPDHEKIIIVENRREDSDYYKDNYERLIMMNSDGTDRSVIKGEFLGNWNNLSWKQDSSGFMYYHHVFDWTSGVLQKIPKYISFDISKKSVKTTDLSDSDLGKDENILLYTKSGNLFSWTYYELYDGQTGAFIADLSSEMPPPEEMMNMMGGWDICTGEWYLVDSDGSNLRRFTIPGL